MPEQNPEGITLTEPAQNGFTQGAGEAGGVTIAQDPPTPTQPTNGTSAAPSGPSWEAVERARQEEKDKLYPELTSLRSELKTLQEQRQAEIDAAAATAAAAEAEAQRQREAEMDARGLLETRSSEWESRFTELQQQIASRDALLEQERRYTDLMAHRSNVMLQRGDNILPELRDLVQGNTPDEIDRSVALLEERSLSILQNVAPTAPPPPPRGPSVTAPPVGPMESGSSTRTYTPQELKDMPMSEYAQLRDRLLGAANPTRR